MKGGERRLNNRLKEYRESHGMTQEDLAEKTGISRATISRIENNREVNLTMKTIAKIASVFGVEPSIIFML